MERRSIFKGDAVEESVEVVRRIQDCVKRKGLGSGEVDYDVASVFSPGELLDREALPDATRPLDEQRGLAAPFRLSLDDSVVDFPLEVHVLGLFSCLTTIIFTIEYTNAQ